MTAAPASSVGLLVRDDQRPVSSALFRDFLGILVGGTDRAEIADLFSHPLRFQTALDFPCRDRVRHTGKPVSLPVDRFDLVSFLLQGTYVLPDGGAGDAKLPAQLLSGDGISALAQCPENLIPDVHILFPSSACCR